MTATFSLLELRQTNPALFRYFVWPENSWPEAVEEDAYVHMGCESLVLPGFLNLDFLPGRPGVHEWEALGIWPDRLNARVRVFYSEDFIEHFFLNEQLYLYCSMNCLLKPDGRVRTLTPNMDSLWRYGRQFDLEDCLRRGDDYYVSIMRCRDGMEAVNMGMRMGGHRWLHTPESLSRVARLCGFDPTVTTCATSSDPRLCGINLRMEYGNGISFALEMAKARPLRRLYIPPSRVLHAEPIEDLSDKQRLYRSTSDDPAVVYDFPPVEVRRIALVNVRGANTSQYREHNFAKCYFRLCEAGAIYADRTLQSAPYMNLFNRVDIETAMAGRTTLESLRFDPGERKGEYFTTGPLELFLFDDDPPEEPAGSPPAGHGAQEPGPVSPGAATPARAASYRCRQGEVLCFPSDQPVSRSLELYGEWAQREIDTMLPLIPPGATVVDAGAHIGLHALSLARHVGPEGRVLALEPRADQFSLLLENIRRNELQAVVLPRHAALSDAGGTLYVPCSEGDAPRNLAATRLRDHGPGDPVACTTVDDLDLDRLDFLKIDAERHTLAALRGAEATVRRLRPVVALECGDFRSAHEALQLFQAWDYVCAHRTFFAYNPDNLRAEGWNIFGMAEEGMLFGLPRERALDMEPFLKTARPVLNDADILRACVRTLRYGGLPLRGTEPWHLVAAWAEERRSRKEEALNELLAALRAQRHQERVRDANAVHRRAREILEAHGAEDNGGPNTGRPLAPERVRALLDLLTNTTRPAAPRGRIPFGLPASPPPSAWEALASRARNGHPPLVDVIIPVHNAAAHTEACLHAVLSASCRTPFRVLVVDDASTDTALADLLDRLAAAGQIDLVRHEENRGFVASANAGMAAHGGRDVVLLNSDTLVFDGWLDRLRQHARHTERVGTVTPLSNNATIFSYPAVPLDSAHDLFADPAGIHGITSCIHAGKSVEIPTAVGFCMYVRRDCLTDVGLFDERLFGNGYGEENDFCLRAAARGWSHRLAMDVYVWHEGGCSFQERSARQKEAAYERVCDRYPAYKRTVEGFLRRRPLSPFFTRLANVRLKEACGGGDRKRLLFVSHNWGGGTERQMQSMAEILRGEGIPVLVMRPTDDTSQCRVSLNSPCGCLGREELCFTLPEDLGPLVRELADLDVAHAHVHCLAGYHAAMPDVVRLLCRLLGIAYDFLASDFLCLCPRAHALTPEGRYCGLPSPWSCRECIERDPPWCGPVDMRRWRDRYAAFVRKARRLFVPTEYMARQMLAHFPRSDPLVRPYPELHLPGGASSTPKRREDERRHVVVIGAIGEHKGMKTLLACARDARARGLPLRFTVLGYTCDDAAARGAGVQVTGPYEEEEALDRLEALSGDVALLPSVWPETYCYTLSVAALSRLFPVVFDIGAQAERIREWGWGTCLPLDRAEDGAAMNDALLGCRPLPPPEGLAERIAASGRFGPAYFSGYYDLPMDMLEG